MSKNEDDTDDYTSLGIQDTTDFPIHAKVTFRARYRSTVVRESKLSKVRGRLQREREATPCIRVVDHESCSPCLRAIVQELALLADYAVGQKSMDATHAIDNLGDA